MSHGIPVVIAGTTKPVDGRDVADVEGWSGPVQPDDPLWRQAAERYVDAHPRRITTRFSERQRMAILRRLAAGPADTQSLLRAMRTVGWVGATDLENRLRELGGGGQRTGGESPAPLVTEAGLHRLAQPFPDLEDLQRTALGHAKALVAQQPTPLAVTALQALDGMLPGVGAHSGEREAATMRLSTRDMERFESARVTRTPVEVAYYSMNSAREKTYVLVPVEYVPAGPAMKVVCVDVHPDGGRGDERQFALERVRSVRPTDLPPLEADALTLRRETLHLVVLSDLYRIMRDRNQFNIRDFEAVELDGGLHLEVRGSFPVALGWDVMEQMCAWAGSVVVYEPLWLVNAVMRRLLAGVSAMQDGVLRLEKPRPADHFAGLDDAAFPVQPDDDGRPVGPRKLLPPGR